MTRLGSAPTTVSPSERIFVGSEVRESQIFGKGLFAAQDVKKGTIVCSFTLGAKVMTEQTYVQACDDGIMPIMRTGTRYAGRYFTFGNEDAPYNFINHSFTPNLLCHCGVVLALQDIGCSEELTLDYRFLIDTIDIAAYDDAPTGRPIRGFPAKEAMLRSARLLIRLLEEVEEWDG